MPTSPYLNRIEDDSELVLPPDVVTQKLAFIGSTGSGKTYAATSAAERMMQMGAQIVALDPVGVWRGLRMGGDFKVHIFGGESADIAITPESGALIAETIVAHGVSAVVDVSQFDTDSEKARFVTAFAARLFTLKKKSPSPIHIFLEECQEFCPQHPQKGEERMLHEMQRIWKIGRNFGIGGSLITQRPQEVSKKLLNQTGTLFCFRLLGSHERKAVDEWAVSSSDAKVNSRALPELQTGEAYLWSPSFLDEHALVKILPKSTSDISATPKMGDRPRAAVKPIDSEKLRAAMASLVEEQKANDPAELRKRIRELEAQAKIQKPSPAAPIFNGSDLALLCSSRERLCNARAAFESSGKEYVHAASQAELQLSMAIARISKVQPHAQPLNPKLFPKKQSTDLVGSPTAKMDAVAIGAAVGEQRDMTLSKCERALLTVLAQHNDRGMDCPKNKLALISGYSVSSSGFQNSLSKLRVAGYAEGTDPISCTSSGRRFIGALPAMLTGDEAVLHWIKSLGKCPSALLNAIRSNGSPMFVKDLAELAGYSLTSSGFQNSLSELRVRGLVVTAGKGPDATARLHPDLQ